MFYQESYPLLGICYQESCLLLFSTKSVVCHCMFSPGQLSAAVDAIQCLCPHPVAKPGSILVCNGTSRSIDWP